MAPKENQEDELFEELKNDLNVRLEKSFKASREIIQAQRKTIQDLEVKLESTEKNFHNFIQEMEEVSKLNWRGKKSDDFTKLKTALTMKVLKLKNHYIEELRCTLDKKSELATVKEVCHNYGVDDAYQNVSNGVRDCDGTMDSSVQPKDPFLRKKIKKIPLGVTVTLIPLTSSSIRTAEVIELDSSTIDEDIQAKNKSVVEKDRLVNSDGKSAQIALSTETEKGFSAVANVVTTILDDDKAVSDKDEATTVLNENIVKTEHALSDKLHCDKTEDMLSMLSGREESTTSEANIVKVENNNFPSKVVQEEEEVQSDFEKTFFILDELLSKPRTMLDIQILSPQKLGKRSGSNFSVFEDNAAVPKKKVKIHEEIELVSLPENVLVNIFNFLPSFDLLNSVVTVCKLFHQIVKHPDIRLSIRVGRAIKAHKAQELINKKGSQIQEIIFTQCAVATIKKVHLTSLSNLKSIQIQFVKSRIPQETIKQFSKLTQLSRLKFWDLPQGCGADVVQECKNIKHIHLEMYPMSYNEFIAAQHPNARSLTLDLCESPQISTENFTSGFASSFKPNLLDLSLFLKQINDSHLEAISVSCPKLVSLTMKEKSSSNSSPDSPQISSSAIMAIFDTCKDMKALKITAPGVGNLATLVCSNPEFSTANVQSEIDYIYIQK